MRDPHRLRVCGGAAGQLQQGGRVLADRDRLGERLGVAGGELSQIPVHDRVFFQHLGQLLERSAQQHQPGADHLEHPNGVFGPVREIGALRGLMQHGHAAAAEPHALHRGRDNARIGGEDRDDATGTEIVAQRPGYPPCLGVHLGPRPEPGLFGLTRR